MPKWLQIVIAINQLVPADAALIAQIAAAIHGTHVAAGSPAVDLNAVVTASAAQTPKQ